MNHGYDPFDDDKRQDLVPFPRMGRMYTWADKRQGLVPFPRVGRSVSDVKRQGLIPFPRVGRSVSESSDAYWGDTGATADNDITESPYTDWGILVMPYKRRSSTFTPRIGRKRRSINQGDINVAKDQDDREMSKPFWTDTGYSYQRDSRQIIPLPRIGRAFVPRLGKRQDDYLDDMGTDEFDGQRFYTPRIGRAFTPRIGRAFTPRIGRAFTPRIGRTPFTPRIGRRDDKTAVESSSDDDKSSSSSAAKGM
ncbi:uncharacterized protein LOC135393779 isoform X2 [Ornithodoros turicata]|uniref:uncharacterized protein LOC135393779 isoform X2 n=1 Tax=Ornithodoros turicata TaxID=34597 RepID=UPI0031390D80